MENLKLRIAGDVIFRDLGDEVVMLDLKSGVYCGLNEVGAKIWGMLQEPKTMAEIRDALLGEYNVSAEQCEAEVKRLIMQLMEKNLVETVDEKNTQVS